MTVEVWFDFCPDAKIAINELNKALDSFLYKDDVLVQFKSLNCKNKYKDLHALMHQVKRHGITTPLILDLMEHSKSKNSLEIDDLIAIKDKYNLPGEVIERHLKKDYYHVLENHCEHARLKKVVNNPTLVFSYGEKLINNIDSRTIKLRLIDMYEKEKNIEYCDCEDCNRDS